MLCVITQPLFHLAAGVCKAASSYEHVSRGRNVEVRDISLPECRSMLLGMIVRKSHTNYAPVTQDSDLLMCVRVNVFNSTS